MGFRFSSRVPQIALRLYIFLTIFIIVRGQFCSKGWMLHGETYYRGDTTLGNYGSGQDKCRTLGGKLAILKTEEENRFVKSLSCDPPIGLYRYWIGMTDLGHEDNFEWNDGTYVDLWQSGLDRWAPREPNDRWGQDCVAFITSSDPSMHGKWSTEVCERSMLFSVCQKQLEMPKLLQSPEVTEVRSRDLKVTWTKWNELMDQGDGPVLGYYVNLKNQNQNPSDWNRVGFVPTGDPYEFFVQDLEPATAYQIAVSLLHGDSMREGPLGPAMNAETLGIEMPKLIQSPEVTKVTSRDLNVTWTDWNEWMDQGDGPVLGYYVNIKNQNQNYSDWTRVWFVPAGDPCEFLVQNLEPATTYQIAVSLLHGDSMREGPLGPAVNAVTPDIGMPESTNTTSPVTMTWVTPSTVLMCQPCEAMYSPSRRQALIIVLTGVCVATLLVWPAYVWYIWRLRKMPSNPDVSKPPVPSKDVPINGSPPPSYRKAYGLPGYDELMDYTNEDQMYTVETNA